MECAALGLPSVTNGPERIRRIRAAQHPRKRSQRHLRPEPPDEKFRGFGNDLVEHLLNFVQLNRRERIEIRNKVRAP